MQCKKYVNFIYGSIYLAICRVASDSYVALYDHVRIYLSRFQSNAVSPERRNIQNSSVYHRNRFLRERTENCCNSFLVVEEAYYFRQFL